jgi:hypothetical protein
MNTSALDKYKKRAFQFFNYKDFTDVPKNFRTAEGACYWLNSKLSRKKASVAEMFNQIPPEMVSDDLRLIALMKDATFINHIEPKDTEQYLEMFMTAYLRGDDRTHPHPDYRTAATVERMMDFHGAFECSYFKQPWIAEVMTPAQMTVAAERYIRMMVRLPMEHVSQKALENHLKQSCGGYTILRQAGKLKLAARYLKTGSWPTADGFFEEVQSEPKDLLDALRLMESDSDEVCVGLYMAWVLAQPIEQVVPLMTSPKLISLAIEMYSAKELRPHLKTNRNLKAAMLEESLGL